MGGSFSKAAGTASSARKYPTTSSILKHSSPPQSNPNLRSKPAVSTARDEVIDLDARDPDFGSRLSRIGPVQPTPTTSNPSAYAPMPQVVTSPFRKKATTAEGTGQAIFPSPSSNPALMMVEARARFAKLFEEESENLGRPSFKGRTLVKAEEIKKILSMRDDHGKSATQIEKQLHLRPGLVEKLGGMIGNA